MRKQFSTSLEDTILRRLKIFCAETDGEMNTTIEDALKLFLSLLAQKDWAEVYKALPDGMYSNQLKHFIEEKGLVK